MAEPLLPPNATPLETALADVSGRVSTIPVGVVRTLWDPWTCPADLLPWLAWACSVDVWDDAWPEDTRRRVIADSHAVHSIKGTLGAVKRALAALGYDTRVIEWHRDIPRGDPFTFRLEVDVAGKPVTDATHGEIEAVALASKNVRSRLAGIRATARVSGPAVVAAAVVQGDALTVLPFLGREIVVPGPVWCGGAATLVDTLTVLPAAGGA